MAIDLHAHWTPRGLARASSAGRDWYGLRLGRDEAGREVIIFGSQRLALPVTESLLMDPSGRAAARRARDDVDFEALLLTGTFWNYHLDEANSARFCREVNDEMAEVQKAYPDRFRGMAVLPMQHPELAIKELDRVTSVLGLGTIAVGTNVCGLNLDDPRVLPVLETAAKLDLSIVVHPTSWRKAGEERFPRYNFVNSFGSPLEDSLAVMSIVYSGLLDRFPLLRIMFTHGGGWVHFGVGRLNLRYEQTSGARPMSLPPADYLRLMYFDCLVHDADALGLLKKRSGPERVVIGTDYPGSGDIIGGATSWIKTCGIFTKEEQHKVLYENPARFLGIPLPSGAGGT